MVDLEGHAVNCAFVQSSKEDSHDQKAPLLGYGKQEAALSVKARDGQLSRPSCTFSLTAL